MGPRRLQVLNRDRKYAREFLIRNQDKILWATDEGWWSFGSQAKQMNQHYTFPEELDLPVSENIDIVEKRYRELGGEITVIRKPGVDHHPHSLKDPAPIVDFALRAMSR